MKLPTLEPIATAATTLKHFGGYRRAEHVAEGEWCDMKNLTSSHYPLLATRPVRGRVAQVSNLQGLVRYDALCYVAGSRLMVGGYPVEMGLTVDSTPKKIARMGAYAIILPDKRYLNLTDLTDHGEIEAHLATTGTLEIAPCLATGEEVGEVVFSASEPTRGEDEEPPVWIDTSTTPHVMRVWAVATKSYTAVATTYLRLSATGIGAPFREGDAVTFTGLPEDLDGTHALVMCDKDFVVIAAPPVSTASITTSVKLDRSMPVLDFIVEAGNRLWGCHYGVAADGSVVNEIYASALGDFRNWQSFGGLSTDSYVVGVGSDGPFTGAVTYLGEPIFFKEHFMHRVSGAYPAAYRVISMPCRGVQKGSAESLAVVGEHLYYKAEEGVCVYDGSLPSLVSAALGDARYDSAAAGAYQGKYYVSMRDTATNGWHFFVYDTARGLWHREDSMRALAFCSVCGELYFMTSTGQILSVGGTGTKYEGNLAWYAESGPIAADRVQQYLTRVNVRFSLARGARIRILVQYDSAGEFEQLFSTRAQLSRGITAVLRPRRCDHLRLRFEGVGEARIHAITRVMERGSEYRD